MRPVALARSKVMPLSATTDTLRVTGRMAGP
jgi:hypothetical protein